MNGDTDMPIDLNPIRTRMKDPKWHQIPNPQYTELNALSEKDREIRPAS